MYVTYVCANYVCMRYIVKSRRDKRRKRQKKNRLLLRFTEPKCLLVPSPGAPKHTTGQQTNAWIEDKKNNKSGAKYRAKIYMKYILVQQHMVIFSMYALRKFRRIHAQYTKVAHICTCTAAAAAVETQETSLYYSTTNVHTRGGGMYYLPKQESHACACVLLTKKLLSHSLTPKCSRSGWEISTRSTRSTTSRRGSSSAVSNWMSHPQSSRIVTPPT